MAFLYLNQFREGLIDARVQSLQTQGEIIAAAISASASVDTDTITVDPEKLLQQGPNQAAKTGEDSPSLEFSINPERVGPVLRRLVIADAHAGPHLRSRRLPAARFALAVEPARTR